jgi:hypothetical protein
MYTPFVRARSVLTNEIELAYGDVMIKIGTMVGRAS